MIKVALGLAFLLGGSPALAEGEWKVKGNGVICSATKTWAEVGDLSLIQNRGQAAPAFRLTGAALEDYPRGTPLDAVLEFSKGDGETVRHTFKVSVTKGDKPVLVGRVLPTFPAALARFKTIDVKINQKVHLMMELAGSADAVRRFNICLAQMNGKVELAY
jgi:hypothetical protein